MRGIRNNFGGHMADMNRRLFLASAAGAATLRSLPRLASAPPTRRILTLVYDKGLGMMRAIERVVH